MDKEEHKVRHQLLHKEFDELLADFIQHNDAVLPGQTTIMKLVEWSYGQTITPTEEE